MKRFWDRKAQEDAFYFVDSRQEYRNTEPGAVLVGAARPGSTTHSSSSDARVGPNDTVVEIGCGVGRLTRALAEARAPACSRSTSRRRCSTGPASSTRSSTTSTGCRATGPRWPGSRTRAPTPASRSSSSSTSRTPRSPSATSARSAACCGPGAGPRSTSRTDPAVHSLRPSLKDRLRAIVGRAPRGRTNPAWMGSAVELDDVREAAAEGGLEIEKVWGAGTQYCLLRLRRA